MATLRTLLLGKVAQDWFLHVPREPHAAGIVNISDHFVCWKSAGLRRAKTTGQTEVMTHIVKRGNKKDENISHRRISINPI